MTVSSTTRRAGPFLGDGSTTAFPFTFKVFKKQDIQVVFTDAAGNDTTLVLDSAYTVALNLDQDNNPGGTITYPRPTSGIPNLAVGESLTVVGALDYNQPTDLPNLGPYFAQVVENSLDRATIQIQQLKEISDRSLQFPPSSAATGVLPDAVERADKLLGFDSSGNPAVYDNGPTSSAALQNRLANPNDVADGDAMLAVKQPFTGAVAQTQHDVNAERISVSNFGAAPGNTSAQNLTAFLAAEAATDGEIYVPTGVFKLTTPMALGQFGKYYGPGVLQFDQAEWWRRGGSSGGIGVPERYTLFYDYASQGDVSVLFNGVTQAITFVDDFTVEAPGSLATDEVKIVITNGTLTLGLEPQYVRAYNMLASGAADLNPTKPSPVPAPTGYFNAAYGPRAMPRVRNGVNNTAVGALALLDTRDNINCTAVGFQALYRTTGEGNTAVGSIAGEWLTTGTFNSLFGLAAGAKLVIGTFNTAVGNEALGESQAGDFNVAVGYRALGNSGANDPENCVAVGAFAGDLAYGGLNTFVGYRAGAGTAATDGAENVFVGFFAGRNQNGADYNVGSGVSSLLALTSGQNNVAIGHSAASSITTHGNNVAVGFEALKLSTASSQTAVGYRALAAATSATGNTAIGNLALNANQTAADNTAVGEGALFAATGASNTAVGSRALNAQTTATNNTAVGFETARFTSASNQAVFGFRAGRALTTGSDNTAVGADALQFEDTGTTNTAVGRRALRLKQDGTNQTGFSNATGLGFDAAVSGSNQVQLGNSATTTYVYGTVQNRSDARDKEDIRDTAVGLDFIEALRPVDYRWDMREDYTTTVVREREVMVPSTIVGEDGEPFMVTAIEQYEETVRLPKDGSKKRVRFHHGLIAQEVKAASDALGVDFGGFQDHTIDGGCDVLTIGYDELIAPLIKAVQQLSARVKELEGKPQ